MPKFRAGAPKVFGTLRGTALSVGRKMTAAHEYGGNSRGVLAHLR